MGVYVVDLSHSDRIRVGARSLGCDEYSTLDPKFKEYDGKLSHILCTSSAENFPWSKYLSLLEANGKIFMVTIPLEC